MRRATWSMAGGLLLGLAVAAAGSQERGMGGVGITVFADTNYRGENASFDRNVDDLENNGWKDRIRSARPR